ncbi:MAG: peptidoglycan DD-metalloendopeptidase family protein [Pseudomonadota bacterium]
MDTKKSAILAQKPAAPKWRWAVALAALPLFSVAAFGIAPQTQTETVEIRNVSADLPLPTGLQPLASTEDGFWQEVRIQRGDTVASLLARLGVNDTAALAFLRSTPSARAIHQLKPGKTIRAQTNSHGELLTLQYLASESDMLVVEKSDSGFKAGELPLDLETHTEMKSGEIKSSLFAATDAAGLPDNIAVQIADVFSSDIDFHRDLRRGDKFTVVYETYYNNGELVKTGRILAAEFVNDNHAYQALYFEDQDGHRGYYSPDGKSLRKAFLRSPIEFSRISSGFSNSRFHPVLNKWRAHKGVDYAAPIGTRVKVTGNGTVSFVGKQGGYGNAIIVQHPNGYSTVYGHLSAFTKGLRPGQRVAQGDVIGFVGMTGLASGPHLHYEFRVNGVQRDPLRIVMPPAAPITAEVRPLFEQHAQPLMQQLSLLRDTNLIRFD